MPFLSRRRPSLAVNRNVICEFLETRRLMAASPVAETTLVNGTLLVEGDRRLADVIAVSLNSTTSQIDVTTNGSTQSFDLAAITSGIRIDSQGGNDTVTVDESVTLPVFIDGGKGNDDILGGGGDDSIHGGKGNDICDGRSGDDFVIGDAGHDTLHGSSGDDDLDGGAASDSVTGDDGNDRVRGGAGSDDVQGGTGDDDIRGGRGRDRVGGGSGRDSFDDDRDTFDDRGVDDNPNNANAINLRAVPAAVLTAFNTQFPGATIREVELESEDAGLLYKFDFFTAAGLRQRARFTAGGTLSDGGNSGGGDGNGVHLGAGEVPDAVTTAFNTRYPSATIREIELEQENIGPVYKFDFNSDGQRLEARFTADGTLVRERVK